MDDDAIPFESLHELIDNARHVMKNPAFQKWRAVMEQQMVGRRAVSSTCMKNMEEALERNFMNGEASGIQAALQMWDLLIQSWETEKQRRLDEANQQKEN